MTPDAVAALVAKFGETLTLRRVTPRNDVVVKAFVRSYTPESLIGDIQDGDRQITIANAEILAAAWPGPPRRNDKIVRDGVALNVETVETRKLGDDPALHVMRVRG